MSGETGVNMLDALLSYGPRGVNLIAIALGLIAVWTVRHRHAPRFGHFAAARALLLWLEFSLAFWLGEYVYLLLAAAGVLEGVHPAARPVRDQVVIILLETGMLSCALVGVGKYWRRLSGQATGRWSVRLLGLGLIAVIVALVVVFVHRPCLAAALPGSFHIRFCYIPDAMIPTLFMAGLGAFFFEAFGRLEQPIVARFLLSLMLAYALCESLQVVDPNGDRQQDLDALLFVACIFLKGPLFGGLAAMGLVGRVTVKLAQTLKTAVLVVDADDRVISNPAKVNVPPLSDVEIGAPVVSVLDEDDAERYGRWRDTGQNADTERLDDEFRLKTGEFVRLERWKFGDRLRSDTATGTAVNLLADEESYVAFIIQDPAYMSAAAALWTDIQHMLRGNLNHVKTLLNEAAGGANSERLSELAPLCTHLIDEVNEQILLIQHNYVESGYAKSLVRENEIDLVQSLRGEVARWKRVITLDAKHYNISIRGEANEADAVGDLIHLETTLQTFRCAVPSVIVKTTLREMLLNALVHRSHGRVIVKLERSQEGRPLIRVTNYVRDQSEEDIMRAVSATKGGVELVRRALRFTKSYLRYRYVGGSPPRLTATWKI